MNYGIELYGSASSNTLSKLQVKQNQLLKVLFKKEWRYSTDSLHRESKLLKISDLYELRILTFVRKCLRKETIPMFHNYYQYQRTIHNYETRDDLTIRPMRSNSRLGASRIHTRGASLWNNNETARENLDSTIDNYKHKLKDFFINRYLY